MDDHSADRRETMRLPRDVLEVGAPLVSKRADPEAKRGGSEGRSPGTAPRPPGRVERALAGAVRTGGRAAKILATGAVLAVACVAGLLAWASYVTAPWTRDGRVRVQVANVAPQISGQITEIRIVDNQYVHKGDVLYVIDRFDYENALDQARTQVRMKAADFQVKSVQAERRQHLTDLSTTPEQQQQYAGNARQAEAAFASAQVSEALAEINLDRTSVRSPVNGFVTNIQMRLGDYAREGTSDLSIIDADSFWIDGYFEETKMAHVCVGDRAEAQLMGYRQPVVGVVESVTRGIAVSDASPGTQGLPSVDPVYTWVRLAQRVPVRIRITEVPKGVPLVSGMTATVSVQDHAPGTARHLRWDAIMEWLPPLSLESPARQNCVPPEGSGEGRTVSLQTPRPARALSPDEINPGLAPGMARSPEPR